MTKTLESVQILLAGSTYLYKLFQNIYDHAPSQTQLDILTSDTTKEAFDIFGLDHHYNLVKGLQELTELMGSREEVLDQLNNEYTKLLIGPNKLSAPPWESVYLSKEHLLFQESTLEVRRCYLKHHFLPAEYPHVADDHLALELDFMANLNSMAEKAYEEENFNQLSEILNDQKDFLTNHLLAWIPKFAKQIQSSPNSYLYPNMAILLKGFLEIQTEMIEEIMETI